MKKLIWFCLALFGFSACEINYDPETRYILTSHVEDIDGNAAAGVTCEIKVDNSYASETISSGKTDANGNLTLIFPKAKDDASYDISYFDLNGTYKPFYINNVSNALFTDYTFSVDTPLDRSNDVVPLFLEYVQGVEGNFLQSVALAGNLGVQPIDFMPQEYDFPYESYAYKNQVITLTYVVIEAATGAPAEYEVQIPIGENPVSYSLTY